MVPYLCERCSVDLATTHVTIVSLGMPFEYHICASCEAAETSKGATRCPGCGLTLKQIQKRGRFGCALDYEVFRSEIEIVVDGYHGSKEHVGKIPFKKIFSS